MAYYCVTFRIANKSVGGKTYADRYELLMQNARTQGLGFWEETTSFLLAESTLSTPAFAKNVSEGLSSADDLVFVFDPADMSASYFGALAELNVLQSFFPKLKKVQ
jgi:hypothetical protein